MSWASVATMQPAGALRGNKGESANAASAIEGRAQDRNDRESRVMNPSPNVYRILLAALIVGAIAGAAGTSLAQQLPAALDKDGLEEVIITGSHIMRSAAEAASPVLVLSRDTLESTGQQNISDILRSVTAEGQGTVPNSFTAGFASGASSISLRGLGPNSTLVLLNGRRLAPYGLADDGTRVFTDLNTLPLEAVDRVEVLKDGASAVYGSDAIAGVVNVILRKTYTGANVTADTGTSYKDDGSSRRIAATFGFGDLGHDTYNVYATAEFSRTDAINNTARDGYLGTENLTPFGYFDGRAGAAAGGRGFFDVGLPNYQSRTPYGTVRVPGGNLFQRTNLTSCPELSQIPGHDISGNPITSDICLYDRASRYQIQPSLQRENIFARASHSFSEAMLVYIELGWSDSKSAFIGTPTSFDDAGPKYCNSSVVFVCPPQIIFLPAGNPDNPYPVNRNVRYLATDFGGRNGTNDSTVSRAVAGVQGTAFGSWSYDVGGGYVQSKLNYVRTGFVRGSVLQADINNGSYRINNPSVSAATRAAISPALETSAKNTLLMADASLSGSVADLPGGKLALAVGAEYRKEKTDSPPVPYTDVGDIIGLGFSAFKSDRSIYAGYVELDAPIVKMLDVKAAYRYDHYSDYGHSTTPEVGVVFKPIKQLVLRATYAEGFRAPGPAEAGSSVSFGFTNIGILSVGNPLLKPEESKNYTYGVVFEPLDGTSLSVDYYSIKRRNEINQADPATIVGNLPTTGQAPNSQRPGLLPGSTLFYDETGKLGTVSAPYTNANSITSAGVDVDVRQKFRMGNSGNLDASLSWTYIEKYERTYNDGSTANFNGTSGPYVQSSATGSPRNHGSLALTWSRQETSVTARANYVGSMKLIDHQGAKLVDNGDGSFGTNGGEGTSWVVKNGVDGGPACGVYTPDGLPFHNCDSGTFLTYDLFGKVHYSDHFELTGSILNATNRMAPFNPYTYGGLNYNPAWTQSGAIGRFFTIGGRYTF